MQTVIIIAFIIIICIIYIIVSRRKNKKRKHTLDIYVNDKKHEFDVDEINVSEEYLEELDRKTEALAKENKEWARQFATLMGYQSNGIRLEKEKNTDGAIIEYEKAFAYGNTATKLHIYNYIYNAERLVILYRKQKEYEKEREIIEQVLQSDIPPKDKAEFEKRLIRTNQLIDKKNER